LPAEEIRRRTIALFPRLTIGEVTQEPKQPFAQAALLYEGHLIARLKVDPESRQYLDAAASRRPEGGPEKEAESKEAKLIPERFVTPLGWIAGLLAVVVTLYYSWKRSLITHLKIAESGKPKAVAALKRTLDYHCYLSLSALAISMLHSWNALGEFRWSLSWLVLGMMATVSASGFFGKYLARTELVRMTWRRFHVPYTVIFFIVLGIHVLQKIKLL